jgi:hypothetical protein
MMLHHLATICLYGGMVVNNAINQGVVCAWLHMICDIPSTMSRLFSHTKYDAMTVTFFLSLIGSWAYTRLYLITKMVYCCFLHYRYLPPFEGYQALPQIAVFMLTTLVLLHFYWFYLFIKMLFGFILKGKTED